MASALGRVVRWDDDAQVGAAVVDGLPVELAMTAGVVSAPGGRTLQPGELVELDYGVSRDGHYTVTRARPTDAGD